MSSTHGSGGYFPAKTDPAIVRKAADAVLAARKSKEGTAYVLSLGGIPTSAGPQELRDFQEREITLLRAIAHQVKIEQE